VFSESENAENDQFFHDVGIQNFEVIYEEQVMAHIQNHTKHDIKNIKISPFFLLSLENSMKIKHVFRKRKLRKCPIFS
jgi:hypothetical protein